MCVHRGVPPARPAAAMHGLGPDGSAHGNPSRPASFGPGVTDHKHLGGPCPGSAAAPPRGTCHSAPQPPRSDTENSCLFDAIGYFNQRLFIRYSYSGREWAWAVRSSAWECLQCLCTGARAEGVPVDGASAVPGENRYYSGDSLPRGHTFGYTHQQH